MSDTPKLNVKNILKLADFIESGKHGFDMNRDAPPAKCGTAGCIGGHAALIWRDVRSGDTFDGWALGERLGITYDDTNALCWPGYQPFNYYERVTRRAAVECLRNLAKTGKVRFLKSLCRKSRAQGGAQ